MSLRETLTAGHTDIFKETSREEVKAVRKFKVPSINENATSYHQLVDLSLEGRVVKASASKPVDSGLIPSRFKPLALKLIFTASLLDVQH